MSSPPAFHFGGSWDSNPRDTHESIGSNVVRLRGNDLKMITYALLNLVLVIGTVVVCTDLSGKEPRRQVGMGRMVTSGSLVV